jgi:NADPH:quinone reductase-like Zn-dependent oxidoreductase
MIVHDANRFDPANAPETMLAVVTAGVGGPDKLEFRRVARPVAGAGEVLLKVLAAGVNNTEVNARLGWYSSSVTGSTQSSADAVDASEATSAQDMGVTTSSPFPFIQGADCCGEVVAYGPGAQGPAPGNRVLVRTCMEPEAFEAPGQVWLGIHVDGAFAQYLKVPASEIFAVDCMWSDAELATVPCAYGTAENQLHRAGLTKGERVLVTGASGGVGSASVQLAKRRGATVFAIAGKEKMEAVRAIGADRVLERSEDPVAALGENAVDLVVDNVAGPAFPSLLQVLKPRGRYVTSGAIAGPVVQLDMRTLYFKDQQLIGCTSWDQDIFPDLISYIERGEIRPVLARTFPLEQIGDAQTAFLEKKHVGNLVLIPPA